MLIDTTAIVPATEANQNSRCTETEPLRDMTEDEKIDLIAARILREHKAAFEELAK